MNDKTHISNWYYEIDSENRSRFVLGTKGERTLICIGINPSTAEPNNLDNTLKSVEKNSYKNGFDSWLMLNVYPQRSTDPNGMHDVRDEKIHQDNLIHIENIFKKSDRTIIWAAWGTLINTRSYLISCLVDIYNISLKYKCEWVTIDKISSEGHPHHPLYLKPDAIPITFDIEGYIRKTITLK